ncbi:MAG: hypothetical protein E7059_04225 [Treponema bryantii]|nr:hypothetical protein [Treponema bryantii]
MKSFKNFAYFLFILLFLSCSSQITDATKTDFSVSIDLGFITNPKNGRLKGLNEVSLDRTYFSSIIESQKQNNSRSVTNQNGSIEFKLYDVTNLQLSQDAKFEDVETSFQQSNIEPLFQEETVIINQKAQVQFKEVDVGIKALILVECAINNADDSIFYNGKSNIFEIKAGENPVTITLSKVVVADPDPDPDPEPEPDPDPEPEPEPEQQVTLTFIVDGVETNLQGTPGESLTKDSPEKQGYTFVEWEPELPSTFPNSNETYTAKWTPNTNTPYKINYFEESLNGTDELDYSETATGTTDEETNINPPQKEGFDVSVNNSNIASDGSTVVTVYYKRKTVTLTFMNGDERFGSVTGKYGYPITTPQPDPTKEGSTFDGWDSIPSTFPATDATYNAKWVTNGQVTSVNFSKDEGPVSINTEISLSCNTQGAQIYYTTDSTQTDYDTSWTRYTDPIKIESHSVTIKAIARAEGKQDSPITTKTYSLFTYSITPIGCELPEELGFGTYYDGDNVDLTKKEPSKEGYSFVGWSLTQNGDVIYDLTFSQELNPINGFVNLYAIWKKIINFNISYPEYQEPGVGIEYAKNDNNTITFTPKIDGDLYEWYLDGLKQSSASSYTFTPDTAGVYCIMLITTINDVPYSSTVTVEVTM